MNGSEGFKLLITLTALMFTIPVRGLSKLADVCRLNEDRLCDRLFTKGYMMYLRAWYTRRVLLTSRCKRSSRVLHVDIAIDDPVRAAG